MSDFHQNGLVTVLHRLGSSNLDQLEKELERHAATNPIALVLPSLYSELENPALKHIVQVLKDIHYVNEIVISLDRASALEFRLAKQFFSILPQRVRIVYNDGPGIQGILKLLAQAELDTGLQGKGRGCWMAFGYVLARGESNVIALHDCDILSYSREYLARLCYPIVNPNLGYEFCKGYYSRVTNRLHGRVTRLYLTPLIRSLQQVAGSHPLLTFLDSFRYPLAGEFAMVRDLAWINRIPGDWGLEVGVLAEIYRNCALRRICQADIADAYEHKHQSLSADNADQDQTRSPMGSHSWSRSTASIKRSKISGIAPVTRLQFEIIGTPRGSSRKVSVAIFMPFRKTSTAIRSSCRSNCKLLMAASF